MSAIKDGGSAFPVSNEYYPNGEVEYGQPGMTLRDWFAGMALGHIPALLDVSDENASCENIAGHAYQIADAMIAARDGREGA